NFYKTNIAFFAIFKTKKKFYETRFIKLLPSPLFIRLTKVFTNYFSVLCPKSKSLKIRINFLFLMIEYPSKNSSFERPLGKLNYVPIQYLTSLYLELFTKDMLYNSGTKINYLKVYFIFDKNT